MKYCEITTRNHPVSVSYPACLEDLNNLLLREGYSGVHYFSNGEVVIDMDAVEACIALNEGGRCKNKSVDISFAIANTAKDNKLMVLVEIRLNYTNANHLKRESLVGKVSNSKTNLTNIIPFLENYIFLFRDDIKEQAKNRLFRMNPKIPNEYLVMDIAELKGYFFT